MTNQQLKEAAEHFVKKFGCNGEIFTAGECIDAVVIHFRGDSGTKVKIVLNRNTGAFLGGTGIPKNSN